MCADRVWAYKNDLMKLENFVKGRDDNDCHSIDDNTFAWVIRV